MFQTDSPLPIIGRMGYADRVYCVWTGAAHKRDYSQLFDSLNEQAKNYLLIHELLPVHSVRAFSSRCCKINGKMMHKGAVAFELDPRCLPHVRELTDHVRGYGRDTAVGYVGKV